MTRGDRDQLRDLNKYVAGVVEPGTPARYLVSRLQAALTAHGDCGTIDDQIIAETLTPKKGREFVNPLVGEPGGTAVAGVRRIRRGRLREGVGYHSRRGHLRRRVRPGRREQAHRRSSDRLDPARDRRHRRRRHRLLRQRVRQRLLQRRRLEAGGARQLLHLRGRAPDHQRQDAAHVAVQSPARGAALLSGLCDADLLRSHTLRQPRHLGAGDRGGRDGEGRVHVPARSERSHRRHRCLRSGQQRSPGLPHLVAPAALARLALRPDARRLRERDARRRRGRRHRR